MMSTDMTETTLLLDTALIKSRVSERVREVCFKSNLFTKPSELS